MKTFPIIKTKRLILRQPSANDIPSIVNLANDPAIDAGTLNIPHPYYEENAIFWVNRSYQGFNLGEEYIFGIELKETSQFIGGIGFILNNRFDRAEIGYWIGKPYWNNGYCGEALLAILHFGFHELKLNKLYASHFSENIASGKVMKKCGMVKEAELLQHVKKGGKYLDIVQYRLTRIEFENLNN